MSANSQSQYEVTVERRSGPTTAEDIKKARALKPQINKPFRLAVSLKTVGSSFPLSWNQSDRDAIKGWAKTLRERGVLSDVVVMNDLIEEGESLADRRLAAARYGADALLLIEAASDIDNYTNPLALLYLTIIGAYIAPGTHADAIVMMQGAVYDVGNGYLYATAESEAEGSTVAPLAYVEDEDALNEAKSIALQRFGDELKDRLTALR
jgi:rhombotail lipoprotein